MSLHKNEVFHYGFLHQMWPNPHETEDLVTFTEETRNAKITLWAVCLDFLPDDSSTILTLFFPLFAGGSKGNIGKKRVNVVVVKNFN